MAEPKYKDSKRKRFKGRLLMAKQAVRLAIFRSKFAGNKRRATDSEEKVKETELVLS